MERNVTFGEHRHARYAAIRLKMVEVDVQQRRAGGVDAAPQCRLDMIEVVEPLPVEKVDDEMHAGAPHPVSDHEVIVMLPRRDGLRRPGLRRFDDREVFNSRRTWDP